jgi:hypothetical protein
MDMDGRRWVAFALLVSWTAACAGAGTAGLERDRSPSPGATSLPASTVPTDPDAAAPAPTLPNVREVAGGFVVDPVEPAPDREEMVGRAALVWHVVPASPSTYGPQERDLITTRFVVDKGGCAEVVAERREAVFAGSRSLTAGGEEREHVLVLLARGVGDGHQAFGEEVAALALRAE